MKAQNHKNLANHDKLETKGPFINYDLGGHYFFGVFLQEGVTFVGYLHSGLFILKKVYSRVTHTVRPILHRQGSVACDNIYKSKKY